MIAPTTPRPYTEVPGPKGRPFLGVARELLDDPFTLVEQVTVEYGGIVRMPMPGQTAFLLSDPDLVQFAFVQTERAVIKPPALIQRVDMVLGTGLVTSVGETWKRNRRIVNPMFTRERLHGLGPLIETVLAETVERWQGRTMIDVRQEMGHALLDLVIRGLFAESQEAMARFDDIADSLLELFRFVARQFVSAIPYDLYLPTPSRLRARARRKRIDGIIADMVHKRRASGQQHGDILGLLMEARDPDTGEGLSLDEIADEVRTLFLAGYETTATALAFSLQLLAEHHVERERLEAEVDRVLGGRPPTLDDLPALTYTTQVFHEAMRLYPPAWLIGRELPEETEMGGYLLPKGALLFVSPWATHRSPANWEAPLAFDPDRFSPERRGDYHRFAYVPFGGGARKCVGTNLAMMEGVLILAGLVQRYRLEKVPGERLRMRGGLTLDLLAGFRMYVTPRQPALPRSVTGASAPDDSQDSAPDESALDQPTGARPAAEPG